MLLTVRLRVIGNVSQQSIDRVRTHRGVEFDGFNICALCESVAEHLHLAPASRTTRGWEAMILSWIMGDRCLLFVRKLQNASGDRAIIE